MKRRVAVLAALLMLGGVVGLGGVGAGPESRPGLEVVVDVSGSPGSAEWAAKAKALCEKWYPRLCEDLDSPGFEAPKSVTLVFKEMKGVAGTGGNRIEISDAWIIKHPDDFGMVIHELVHVVQGYPAYDLGWLVEGIADYERLYVFEPDTARPRVNRAKSKYTDAYRTTAAFLNDLVVHVDPQIVKKLNARLREGRCTLETFKELTGKDVDTLWAEFLDRAAPATQPASGK